MGNRITIKTNVPWIGYSGSSVQQNHSEDLIHGYLLWDVHGKGKYDVKFRQLPNIKPFVTLEWAGTVANTVALAHQYSPGTRYRIKSDVHIAQREIQELSSTLKQDFFASEVTFKLDNHQALNESVIVSGDQEIKQADLRDPDILYRLVRDYHATSSELDETWSAVHKQIKAYVSDVIVHEDLARNTKFSLRNLRFDNTFSYGEGNIIDFDKMSGTVGIFGTNRSGKSSVVGTLMYAIFNTTDRGPMKNLHVCNIRKPYCYTNIVVSVNGTDYVIERQTAKQEGKRGMNAVTSLNLYRIDDAGEAIDMCGEQRNDTEKVIRNLIGTPEDFMLTSLSAQGEMNQFIQHGSTKRRQILSRFLDLDVFDRLYDIANKDVNVVKAQVKIFPDKNWDALRVEFEQRLTQLSQELDTCAEKMRDANEQLAHKRMAMAQHNDYTPVTKSQVTNQTAKVSTLRTRKASLEERLLTSRDDIDKMSAKVTKIDELKGEYDCDALRVQSLELTNMERKFTDVKHTIDAAIVDIKHREKSLKILDDVPCGDQYVTCKFIKDAHVIKESIEIKRKQFMQLNSKFEEMRGAVQSLRDKNIQDQLEKLQKLSDMSSRLQIGISTKRIDVVKYESELKNVSVELTREEGRLRELEEAYKNEENAEVVTLRSDIESLLAVISSLDASKTRLASQQGKTLSDIERLTNERRMHDDLMQKMKIYELIASAFSRKGVPNVITTSRLPMINAEISKILTGIVDFAVELEVDPDTDAMDVYINYGDSRRIIELASGMEKMISSIAIRVALINISSLPKTDTFIIDEGFGALDDASIEACNQLLISLKKYFRSIIIISHVDAVKASIDNIIDITKLEKDSKIVYS